MDGNGTWNESERSSVDKKWLDEKIASEKMEASRRWTTYRKGRSNLDLKCKTVIIVDDGIATGLTMKAAVGYAKNRGAEKVVVAVPVASAEALRALRDTAEVFVLETPIFFSAVGEWYKEFPQVSDEEVIKILSN